MTASKTLSVIALFLVTLISGCLSSRVAADQSKLALVDRLESEIKIGMHARQVTALLEKEGLEFNYTSAEDLEKYSLPPVDITNLAGRFQVMIRDVEKGLIRKDLSLIADIDKAGLVSGISRNEILTGP